MLPLLSEHRDSNAIFTCTTIRTSSREDDAIHDAVDLGRRRPRTGVKGSLLPPLFFSRAGSLATGAAPLTCGDVLFYRAVVDVPEEEEIGAGKVSSAWSTYICISWSVWHGSAIHL